MTFLATLLVALRAIRRNAMRSSLTALGVVIGVGAVIAMVAIGEGAKARVRQSFEAMGTNLLIVLPGASSTGGAAGGFGSQPTLTWDDLRAIRTEASAVRRAAPTAQSMQQVLSDEQNWRTQVMGTTPEYFAIRSWSLASGAPMQDADVEGAAKVALLGRTVADKLFGPGIDPTGRAVRVQGAPFTIAGVLAAKGQSPVGQDFDDVVIVPITTYSARLQGGLKRYLPGAVFIGADSPEETTRAARQITALLRERHHLADGVDDDFSIRNLTEMADAMQGATQTLTTLLAAIAAVSLLVGGIGIMNIMLVSVTERTREIGLRMAIGATPGQILAQFLVEALTLAALGGAVGIALGTLAAQKLAASFGWPLLLRPDVAAAALAFSALVGVVFGLYPARRAARLDPIEALRYE